MGVAITIRFLKPDPFNGNEITIGEETYQEGSLLKVIHEISADFLHYEKEHGTHVHFTILFFNTTLPWIGGKPLPYAENSHKRELSSISNLLNMLVLSRLKRI